MQVANSQDFLRAYIEPLMRNSSRRVLFGVEIPYRKVRRGYVAANSVAIFLVFLIALAHPDNRMAQTVLGTTVAWFPSGFGRSRGDITIDMPRNYSELNPNDLVLFRSYRILTWIWIVFAVISSVLFLESPYQNQTWWHAPFAIVLVGVAVLSVNLPKAMLIWNTPD